MVSRRVAAAVLLLLAVQYAAIGVAPGCADGYSHAARAVAQAAAPHGHATHGLGSPCAPAHQDSAPQHSPAGCLGMTGCATAGIAAVATPQLITPECTAERTSLSRALFVSVLPTPETPPPIA